MLVDYARFTGWLPLFTAIAAFAVIGLFRPGAAHGEPLAIGGGLTVEPPENLDLTFQVIPSYDEKKEVLAGWNGKSLRYFIGSPVALPPEYLSADKYLNGLIRDLRASSANGTCTVERKGTYQTAGGLSGTYLEYSFVPRGSSKPSRQVAHFLSNSKKSFIAFATPVDEAARDELLDGSIAIFRTAALGGTRPAVNSPDKDSDAGRLVGKWVGEAMTANGKSMVSHTEIQSDGRFAGEVSLDGKVILRASGLWSLEEKVLTWNYLYSSPDLPEDARLDKDELVSVDAQNLVIVSKKSGQERRLKREN